MPIYLCRNGHPVAKHLAGLDCATCRSNEKRKLARQAQAASPRTAGPWKKIATAMWEQAGKPEWDSREPTSVGRHSYEREAKAVLQALYDMVYQVRRISQPKGKP